MTNFFEESPTTSKEKSADTATPEAEKEERPNEESLEEATGKTASFLNSENRGFLSRMSERGKSIANQLYEGLYKIPGINRVVGKMEIAYNQFWQDRHEEKAVELKNEMGGLDIKIGASDQSRQEIESLIENLKQQKIPGVESLQLKMKDLDSRRIDLLNKKDKVQSKFEARENKMKLHANERDRVADNLIGHYNEKLEPMEKELENLQTCRDQTDLLFAVAEIRHKDQLAILDGIEKKKTQIEEVLRGTGMSEKKIRKFAAVKTVEDIVVQGRKNIQAEKERLARQKAEIDKKIADVDARANPYRDRREEFGRIKEGRPLKMEVAPRKRAEEFKEKEEIEAHAREEISEAGHAEAESSRETETETAEEGNSRLKISSYIAALNTVLQKKYGKNASGEMIDQKDFLRATRLSADYKLDPEDFENIFTKYCKLRKMPVDKIIEALEEQTMI